MSKRLNKFGEELGELLEFQNISIQEYAERIGTTSKNLIDIINGKVSLSFNLICNISFISEEKNISIRQFINNFHYKDLNKIYNISFKNDLNDYSIARSILKYLRITNPIQIYKEDNVIFYKSKNDKPELLALWLEHCYRTVKEQKIGDYKKDNIET